MAKAIETLSIKLVFKEGSGSQQIIDKIGNSIKKLQVTAGQTGPSIDKVRRSVNDFAKQGNRSISTIDGQVTALRALRREADINSKEFKELTADIARYEKQLNKAQGRRGGGSRGSRVLAATQTAGAVISGGIFGGPEGLVGSGIGAGLGAAFGSPVAGAYLGAGIGAGVGNIRKQFGGVAETVAEINAMKIALAGVSTSAEDYKKSIDSVMSISKEFLFPVDKAIGEFTRLKAAVVGAGFGTKETTDAFKGFAAAILATGGNSEKLSGALLAASQVFSKGKVQAEELRGQIGERLPGAFTTFAQSIGVGSKDLDEMLRKGEVSTENFVEFTRTLFARYEKTAETLGSSPEKAGQRLQLALSLATIEYGGFFQNVGAGFQDYITGLVTFATENKETFKKVAANVVVFAQDVKTVIKGLITQLKDAFGGMFVFIGQSLKVFVEQIVAPFFNVIKAGIEGIAKQVNLGQAERKLGGVFGRAAEIRAEELEAYRQEKGIIKPGKLGTSIADNDEIERRSQIRILEEAGMAPKSRDDMFAEAMKGLDKAFAVFDPSSGFGTSLGKNLDTGPDGGVITGGTGGGTNRTQSRIDSANEIVRKLQDQLGIQKQQSGIGKLIAKQAKERSDLEAQFVRLQKEGEIDAVTQANLAAQGLLDEKQKLALSERTNAVIAKATKPIEDITNSIQEKIRADKEYARLIAEGVNPELAKQLMEIEKRFSVSQSILNIEIDLLRNAISKSEKEEQTTERLRDQVKMRGILKELEEGKASIPNLKEKAVGAAKEGSREPTFAEQIAKDADDAELALKKLINPANQVKLAAGAIGDAFSDSFMKVVTGKASAQEALSSFFQTVANHFLDMAKQIIAKQLVMITYQTILKALGAVAGASGGGGGTTPPSTMPGGAVQTGPGLNIGGIDQGIAPKGFAANGGPVLGGQPYMVGERGPELFVPGQSGGVMRNEEMRSLMGRSPASSSSPSINFSFETTSIGGTEYVSREQLEQAMAATRKQASNDGAKRGMSMTLDKMQNSPRTRTRIGLR